MKTRACDLRRVEETAALGYLQGAMAHELNNQLTNLLLGTDQLKIDPSIDASDLVVRQAQKLGEIVNQVQKLAQGNMARGKDTIPLASLCSDVAIWLESTSDDGVGAVKVDAEEGVELLADRSNLLQAVVLLTRLGGEEFRDLPLTIAARREQAPVSTWAPGGETKAMAVIRISRGSPPSELSEMVRDVVDHFFERDREPDEVALMAGWEIVRKLRGRLQVYGGAGSPGIEAVIKLPLPE